MAVSMIFKVKRVFTTAHPDTGEALFHLYEADDEESAIEAAKAQHPDLVPSDRWFWLACKEEDPPE